MVYINAVSVSHLLSEELARFEISPFTRDKQLLKLNTLINWHMYIYCTCVSIGQLKKVHSLQDTLLIDLIKRQLNGNETFKKVYSHICIYNVVLVCHCITMENILQ